MKQSLPSLLVAGLALALLELLFTWLRGRSLFLTWRELGEYALAAWSGLSILVVASGALLQRALKGRAWLVVAAGLSAGGGASAGWLLTAGRRVKDLSARPLLVAAIGLGCALLPLCASWLVRRVRERDGGGTRCLVVAGLGLFALGCLVSDAGILPRGYPAFHALLLALAVLSSATAGLVEERAVEARIATWSAIVACFLVLAAPLALHHLARQPNTSFAVSEKAPFTAKLMRAVQRLQRVPTDRAESVETAEVTPIAKRPGVDLRDRDVLLITVDALRADTLRSLGGTGLTPSIDELATQGVVFRRAFTPAPHTSYALASLLTAKFIKPVVELGSNASDHATLPDLMQRYGYRTAAFYPPAIFFVDGARFAGLANRGFGFEYRKEMYASADARVEQLRDYLAHVDAGHPLFVWVHLFEPHEPYEPPAEFAQDQSARGRYDGEVAYADRAIGRMARLFREQRPKATVIVTADHGEEFGDHGGSFHGSTLFDEQVRVPVVWSSPGAVAPAQSDVPIELVDIGSTILSSAGIPRDPRMRGDDLGAVLLGDTASAPHFAFASVEERHMVCDGRYKAVCSAEQEHCQLFDLVRDPREQHNLVTQEAARAQALRRELFAFLGTIAKREALGVQQGVGFPEPLVRARLGAPGAGHDVIPLLSDPRPLVRAVSARVLGELQVAEARAAVSKLSRDDKDRDVRAEAAVAALLLGEQDVSRVVALLDEPEHADDGGLSVRRRAALALGALGDLRALPVLTQLVMDERAQELDRLRTVHTLAGLRDPSSEAALIAALSSVRLREAAASALSKVGGASAQHALYERLVTERYPPARSAEARALLALEEPRAVEQILRFLGMETSLPEGVSLLVQAGALKVPSARGARLLNARSVGGEWQCEATGCAPRASATLRLPAASSRGRQRITVLVDDAEAGVVLRLGDQSFELHQGTQQLAFWREQSGPINLPISSTGRARIAAWVSVPEAPEIPPPAPQPWDGGIPDAAL